MRALQYLLLTFILLSSLPVSAMPPHPDMIEEYKNNGQLKSLMNRVESISSKMNMNSPSKAFPSSGTRKVPVLLVNYATPYTVSSDPLSYIENINKENIPFYGLFFVFMTIMLIVLKKYRINNSPVFRPFIAGYLSLFVFLISCGVDGDDDGDTFPTDTSVYSGILNGNSSSDLSVRKYFQDMSNNNLNLQFDIYGPVKVSKAWEYYGANSGLDDSHPGELVSEALRLMVSRYSSVDFSLYDNDNNGYVDSIIIIHEGRGEESGGGADTIWSHQWDLASAAYYGDGNGPVNAGGGVTFNIYTIQPEYTATRGDSSMGVYAHEFGHVLGLPDLYDTSSATYGVGDWSLMASGSWKGPVTNDGTTPAPLLAWERFKIGGSGWVTMTTLASAAGQVIGDIETTKEVFKVILDSTPGEIQYLIIEGKQSSTSTQWYVPGPAPDGGILITHIHEGVVSNFTASGAVNAGSARVHGVNIREAAGTDLWSKTNSGAVTDLYTSGGITNVIKYTDNASYTLSSTATTIDVNSISGTVSPLSMTFNVVP